MEMVPRMSDHPEVPVTFLIKSYNDNKAARIP